MQTRQPILGLSIKAPPAQNMPFILRIRKLHYFVPKGGLDHGSLDWWTYGSKTTTVVAFPISPLWHSVARKKEGNCFSCLEDSQARQGEQHAPPAPRHPQVQAPLRSADPKVFSQSLAWKAEEAGYPGHCVGTQLSPIPPWSLLTECYEPLSGRGRVEHP